MLTSPPPLVPPVVSPTNCSETVDLRYVSSDLLPIVMQLFNQMMRCENEGDWKDWFDSEPLLLPRRRGQKPPGRSNLVRLKYLRVGHKTSEQVKLG